MIHRSFIVVAATLSVFTAVATWAAVLVVDAGTFDRVWTHRPETLECRTHPGLPGVEDLVRVPGTSLVLLATHTRVLREGERFTSGLFLYDAARPEEPPVQQLLPSGLRFAPHGLGFVSDSNPDAGSAPLADAGAARGWLHVVNHAGVPEGAGDTIEVFRFEAGRARHARTIAFPDFETINAVQPLGETSFWFTNDFGSASHLSQTFEKFLRIPRGGVHFHRDGSTRTVASGLFFGNGLTLSPDGSRLFVAEMLGRALRVYDADQATGDLRERKRIKLDTAPDNVRFDDRGRLLVASHPRLLTLNAHSKDPFGRDSPYHVLALEGLAEPNADVPLAVDEVIADSGQGHSAVSTALSFDGNLLMGMIYRDGLIHCRPRG
jgi:arylesterase/paraoxonase